MEQKELKSPQSNELQENKQNSFPNVDNNIGAARDVTGSYIKGWLKIGC